MTDRYIAKLKDFKRECDLMLNEYLQSHEINRKDDEIVTRDFIFEIIKNIKGNVYFAGSALLYLYDSTVPKPNDIDIYVEDPNWSSFTPNLKLELDSESGTDSSSDSEEDEQESKHLEIKNFKYESSDVRFRIHKRVSPGFTMRRTGIYGAHQTVSIYVDGTKLGLTIQFTFINNATEYIKKNDFDICRNFVPFEGFKTLKQNIRKYVKEASNGVANYMPSEDYFQNYKGHRTLSSYRLVRIHKYFLKGFDIFYNGKQVNPNYPRKTIDVYGEKHPIDLLKDQIMISLEDYNAYRGHRLEVYDAFDRFKNLVQQNEVNKSFDDYYTIHDYTNAYIKALKIRDTIPVIVSPGEKPFEVGNYAKTMDTIDTIHGFAPSKKTINKESKLRDLNDVVEHYLDKTTLSFFKTSSVQYVQPKKNQYKSGHVFNALAKIMNNKDMFITGGGAAHYINNSLPLHDIDVFYHELDTVVFDANIFSDKKYQVVKHSFNVKNDSKKISSITTIYICNSKYERRSYVKLVDGYTLRRFNTPFNASPANTIMKIQFISTIVNPIDVIMDFDFGASKGIIRSVNNELENITMPIYQEMIKKRFTTYDVLPYNVTKEKYLNNDASRRLVRYFFRGFAIQVNESKEKLKYPYDNILTIEDVLYTLYLSYNDNDKNSYYTLDNITTKFNPHSATSRTNALYVVRKIYNSEFERTKYN